MVHVEGMVVERCGSRTVVVGRDALTARGAAILQERVATVHASERLLTTGVSSASARRTVRARASGRTLMGVKAAAEPAWMAAPKWRTRGGDVNRGVVVDDERLAAEHPPSARRRVHVRAVVRWRTHRQMQARAQLGKLSWSCESREKSG